MTAPEGHRDHCGLCRWRADHPDEPRSPRVILPPQRPLATWTCAEIDAGIKARAAMQQ